MSLDAYPVRARQAEVVQHLIKGVGVTTDITKVFGIGVALSWTSTGLYKITWSENPGTFLMAHFGLQATTASAVKGFTVVPGVYSATAFTLAFSVTNAAESLTDLAALQWVNIAVWFKTSAV